MTITVTAQEVQTLCQAHLTRTNERVLATRVVDGEPMCNACFRGRAIRPEEERTVLMDFLPVSDSKRQKRAGKPQGQRSEAA